jgi:hypothetical protein
MCPNLTPTHVILKLEAWPNRQTVIQEHKQIHQTLNTYHCTRFRSRRRHLQNRDQGIDFARHAVDAATAPDGTTSVCVHHHTSRPRFTTPSRPAAIDVVEETPLHLQTTLVSMRLWALKRENDTIHEARIKWFPWGLSSKEAEAAKTMPSRKWRQKHRHRSPCFSLAATQVEAQHWLDCNSHHLYIWRVRGAQPRSGPKQPRRHISSLSPIKSCCHGTQPTTPLPIW